MNWIFFNCRLFFFIKKIIFLPEFIFRKLVEFSAFRIFQIFSFRHVFLFHQFLILKSFLLAVSCLIVYPLYSIEKQNLKEIFKTSNPVRFLINNGPVVYAATDKKIAIFNKENNKKIFIELNYCEAASIAIASRGEIFPSGRDCYLRDRKKIFGPNQQWIQKIDNYSGLSMASGLNQKATKLMIATNDGLIHKYQKNNSTFKKYKVTKISDFNNQNHGKLVPYRFDNSLKYLAVRNWSDYYMHIIDVHSGKLLHKTEYYLPATNSKGNVFSFSKNSRLYFDGKRIRQIIAGKIIHYVEPNNCCILKQSVFSYNSKQIAILKHRKIENKKISIIEIYNVNKKISKKISAKYRLEFPETINTITFDSINDKLLYLGLRNGRVLQTNIPGKF